MCAYSIKYLFMKFIKLERKGNLKLISVIIKFGIIYGVFLVSFI